MPFRTYIPISTNTGLALCVSCSETSELKLKEGHRFCTTCKGTGIDKVHGSSIDCWTCVVCKGFGYFKPKTVSTNGANTAAEEVVVR